MKKIAIFSTTRADFGLFSPILKEIEKRDNISFLLFMGGTHLSKECGYTITEAETNSIKIADTFDYLLNESTSFSLAKASGICTIELAHIFKNYKFDFVCVLGDRYEILPIVLNAILFKKPIIHLGGGSKTFGVIDEQIRNMVSKAAHIHFVSCEENALNLEKIGEPKWRIHNVGSTAVDNFNSNKTYSKKEIFKLLNLDLSKQVVLLTYHPVTLEFKLSAEKQMQNIFDALGHFDFQVVITAPNMEIDRNTIMDTIYKHIKNKSNYYLVDSLGALKYHSLLPHCEFIIGNSSSGIMEVPFFRIPTVNIGDRQKGRVRHQSIIDTDYEIGSIRDGIILALSEDFRNSIKLMKYKLGDGKSAKKIVDIIIRIQTNENLMRKNIY